MEIEPTRARYAECAGEPGDRLTARVDRSGLEKSDAARGPPAPARSAEKPLETLADFYWNSEMLTIGQTYTSGHNRLGAGGVWKEGAKRRPEKASGANDA